MLEVDKNRCLYDQEFKKIAEGNELFMELIGGPNALTPEEIDIFVERRPEQWERFRKFGAKAIAVRQRSL